MLNDITQIIVPIQTLDNNETRSDVWISIGKNVYEVKHHEVAENNLSFMKNKQRGKTIILLSNSDEKLKRDYIFT